MRHSDNDDFRKRYKNRHYFFSKQRIINSIREKSEVAYLYSAHFDSRSAHHHCYNSLSQYEVLIHLPIISRIYGRIYSFHLETEHCDDFSGRGNKFIDNKFGELFLLSLHETMRTRRLEVNSGYSSPHQYLPHSMYHTNTTSIITVKNPIKLVNTKTGFPPIRFINKHNPKIPITTAESDACLAEAPLSCDQKR